MDKDLFSEVTRIEAEADRLLEQAQSDHDRLLKEARAATAAHRREAEKKLEAESARLREEHERALAEAKAAIRREFDERRKALDENAERRTNELADWVASRFLEENRSLAEARDP